MPRRKTKTARTARKSPSGRILRPGEKMKKGDKKLYKCGGKNK